MLFLLKRPMAKLPVFEPNQYLIMAVDDVPSNLKVLQGILIPAGYRVTFATRGKQVLKRIKDVRPDLILLDLMMPEMSGLEVCALLKQMVEAVDIPIVFLTASHELEHLVQAFETGAVDYITKPFNSTELLARVRNHLELSRLRKQAQMQAAWESISRQIVQDIYASIDLQSILDNTTRAIRQFLNADSVMVYRWCDPGGCHLLAIAGDHSQQTICHSQAGCPYLQENPFPMAKIEQRSVCHASPPPTADQDTQLFEHQPALRLPIYQQDDLWGGLVIKSSDRDRSLSHYEIELLTLIVQQLEISIQHAGLHQRLQEANAELERVSNTDGLTQVANRRCLDHRLSQEWQRLQREQQPLSLILCDIDYFKQFNDTYGHPRGDVCLAAVARALQSCIKRPADLVARYGGEEFVTVLPNTYLSGAIKVVQQVQSLVAALKITHETQLSNEFLTLSFGIHTVVPNQFSDVQTALSRADQALYAAKESGRNRYAISPHASDVSDYAK
jgi:diguanylate cyclase (GGDEF)-like protein